jgi:hypothetical protein
MDVIALHRELDDAELVARGGREGVLDRWEDTVGAETGERGSGTQRDVHGMPGDVTRTRAMRNPGTVTRPRLATRAGAVPAPRTGSRKAELHAMPRHLE